MRTLVAGQPATLAEVTYAVENAHGTLPGSVGRVNDVAAALEILDPAEPTILFIVVDDPGDPQLAQVRALVARGARVIVLAKILILGT